MMDQSDTINLLSRLKEGDQGAAQLLWESYFKRMATFAHEKLARHSHTVDDGEDIALSAFKSFCRGVGEGRFPRLNDRDDLWKLLITITRNKLYHSVRDQNRLKRGGQWRQLTVTGTAGDDYDFLEQLIHQEPTPEMAAQFAEECERMLEKLNDPILIELAHLKLEGYTNEEIARQWGKAERTVERKLQLIRKLWLKDGYETTTGGPEHT